MRAKMARRGYSIEHFLCMAVRHRRARVTYRQVARRENGDRREMKCHQIGKTIEWCVIVAMSSLFPSRRVYVIIGIKACLKGAWYFRNNNGREVLIGMAY